MKVIGLLGLVFFSFYLSIPTYKAKQSSDSDYICIGEWIEYSFDMTTMKEPHHLGINTIILANGYKKTRKTWEENSRVRRLKMFVDDKPYCIFELLDSFEFQTIKMEAIMLPQKKVMKFKFVVLDIYPGSKYKDTAISELLFDGVGVHLKSIFQHR